MTIAEALDLTGHTTSPMTKTDFFNWFGVKADTKLQHLTRGNTHKIAVVLDKNESLLISKLDKLERLASIKN